MEFVVDVGVSGGGVMTGEPSAALCAAIAAQILRSASAAAAARCDAVAGAAVLLGSAIKGPGFDSRGSRDAARFDMSRRFRVRSSTCIIKKKKITKKKN